MSYTYKFTLPGEFTADDPATPVSGTIQIQLVFQADSLADAKAQLSSALDAAMSSSDAVVVMGIYEMPPG